MWVFQCVNGKVWVGLWVRVTTAVNTLFNWALTAQWSQVAFLKLGRLTAVVTLLWMQRRERESGFFFLLFCCCCLNTNWTPTVVCFDPDAFLWIGVKSLRKQARHHFVASSQPDSMISDRKSHLCEKVRTLTTARKFSLFSFLSFFVRAVCKNLRLYPRNVLCCTGPFIHSWCKTQIPFVLESDREKKSTIHPLSLTFPVRSMLPNRTENCFTGNCFSMENAISLHMLTLFVFTGGASVALLISWPTLGPTKSTASWCQSFLSSSTHLHILILCIVPGRKHNHVCCMFGSWECLSLL